MMALPSEQEQIIQNGRNSINMANLAHSSPDVSQVYQQPHEHIPPNVYQAKKNKSSKKHQA
jgi:hypothetical protein